MGENASRQHSDADEVSKVVLQSGELLAEVPTRVLIAPWGEVESINGSFLVDAESARAAVEAFEAQGTDLPIDYEHQTLGGRYASPSGQAPAAGWVKALEAVEGEGLVATVAWTPPALEQLAARQYRYLSPVVIVRKADRRLVALHSAALTNKPAITRMRPIVNKDEFTTKARRARRSDHEPVGFTTEAQRIVEARREENEPMEMKGDAMQTAWQELRSRLGLDETADEQAVLVAASERIEDLQGQLARREAAETVAEAMKAGKLTTAQKEWAVALVLRDPALFEQWLASAPVLVPHGLVAPPDGSTQPDGRGTAAAETARREYRQSPLLQALTSEEAYVADAARQQGFGF
jgi:phage I-like protein